MKFISYLKERFDERSTYMFIFASLGTAAAMHKPFNWIAFVILFAAALVPDGCVRNAS